MQQGTGQIASYYALSNNLKYVGVLSANLDGAFFSPESFIVSTSKWQQAGSTEEFYEHNEGHIHFKNCFEISPNLEPYSANVKLLKPSDLIVLTENTSSQMFHGFLTILRKHGISDKTNAFNKVLNLFIAKIVDEFNTPENAELSFQNKGNESLEELYSRIEALYSQGLRDFIKIYIDTDKELDQIKDRLNNAEIPNKNNIIRSIEHLLSKTNSDFQFKDVYDENTYNDNLNILKELVQLISPFKLKYAKKQQFLGDFFENILSNGFKQEAGQYFTPVPLAHFMVSSLPLGKITHRIITDGTSRQLLPRMIDFACGSGHFLTEYMNEMQKTINKVDKKEISLSNARIMKQYAANPFEWSKECVYGLDIDYRLVKTSKVSSFLNGDGDAIIRRANGLDSFSTDDYSGLLHSNSNDQSNKVFDVLIANPPYHVNEFKSELPNLDQDFSLSKYVTDSSSEIEALFIERASQLLKMDGVMAIILPSAILNTENKIYVEARKLLLTKFKIIAIMKNPSKATFAATKVETVIIFAKRRNDSKVQNLKFQIKSIINGNLEDITLNGNEHCISNYIKEKFGKDISIKDYENFLHGKSFKQNKVVQNYNKQYRKERKSSNCSFVEYIREKECESLLIKTLTNNKIIVIQTQTDKIKESLQLLGYKFSGRRGHEGIHSRIKNYSIEDLTLLYGDKDNYLNVLVKNAFNNEFDDSKINNQLKPFYRIINLSDLIDFSDTGDNYKIMLAKALIGKISDYGDKNTIFLNKEADLKNGTSITSENIVPGSIPVIAGG